MENIKSIFFAALNLDYNGNISLAVELFPYEVRIQKDLPLKGR